MISYIIAVTCALAVSTDFVYHRAFHNPQGMKIPGLHTAETQFVDTPAGIYTSSGIWFRTRVAMLQDYAGTVFERVPLPQMITDTEVWLRSPQAITLWLLPLFLVLVSPLQAVLAALVVYVAWKSLGPSFVSRALARAFRFLDLVIVQGLYYVFMCSLLAKQQQFIAVWVGLGGFILLRWGLVRLVTQPLIDLIWKSLYSLPVPDQVLRSMILRTALRLGIALPEFGPIEQQIRNNLHRNP